MISNIISPKKYVSLLKPMKTIWNHYNSVRQLLTTPLAYQVEGPNNKISSIFRKNIFENKVAIVTGGGTGIGKTIATELIYLGCNVVIASRNIERLEKAALDITNNQSKPSKNKLKIVKCNIRNESEVNSLVSKTLEEFHRCDFLVNNSGGQFMAPAQDFSLKGWNAVIETNLTGTYLCCREVFNQWMGQHGGAIVNMVANMWLGWPRAMHSGAARAAVDNMTKTLAIEWSQYGIRVNAVAPGSSILSSTAAANYGGDSIFTTNIKRIPMKRLGTTEEVSSAICYLLSPAASFITGETIKIDGGQSLYSTSVPYEVPDHNNSHSYTWDKDIKEQDK